MGANNNMSNYYIIDQQALTIISGPHNIMATEIKKLTNCGNPDLLGDEYLATLSIVPEVSPALDPETQTYDGVTVSATAVTKNVRALTSEELAAKAQAEQDATIQALTFALEQRYDEVAQIKRYDNRLTCALRAGYPGPFQTEGTAFAVWMDNCNATAYQVMADCLQGLRPIPTAEQLLSEMPSAPW